MVHPTLSGALSISEERIRTQIDHTQDALEKIPGTFYALFWLYSHDFLYVSKSIESVLGYPFRDFEQHGVVYFQHLIPPDYITPIYNSMNSQSETITELPNYVFNQSILRVEAAVFNKEKEIVPVHYQSIILDSRPQDPPAHLLLCSWIDKSKYSPEELRLTAQKVEKQLKHIHEWYWKGHPERKRLLTASFSITQREKEVARLLVIGNSSKEISAQLSISVHTVETHRRNILDKFGARNTVEFIHLANKGFL
jgi:DNA-binding CsgD family transcriptional regulator